MASQKLHGYESLKIKQLLNWSKIQSAAYLYVYSGRQDNRSSPGELDFILGSLETGIPVRKVEGMIRTFSLEVLRIHRVLKCSYQIPVTQPLVSQL